MNTEFKEYDHVIWDNDDYPEVCILVKKHIYGFVSHDNEIISEEQLSGARYASHKEIYDFYNEHKLWN